VPAALAKAEKGVHKIEFSSERRRFFSIAAQVKGSEEILRKTYRHAHAETARVDERQHDRAVRRDFRLGRRDHRFVEGA